MLKYLTLIIVNFMEFNALQSTRNICVWKFGMAIFFCITPDN